MLAFGHIFLAGINTNILEGTLFFFSFFFSDCMLTQELVKLYSQ